MIAWDLQSAIQIVGWTLVHFLWQGVALGLLFALAMRLAASAGPLVRYRIGLTLFMLVGAAPLATCLWLFQGGHAASATEALGTMQIAGAGIGAQATTWWPDFQAWLAPYMPWAVALWLAGVFVMSGRVCADWWQVRRLTRVGVAPLPSHWDDRVTQLVAAFAIARPVRVLRSTIVRVPAVIGWLRPVILLPTAALAGLSPRQLELIVAHELAHIRRADYLVNLLQVFIETVLFYHPAVRWMSNRLRQERELCCDDAVIGTCGDTLTYAHALTELEAQRQAGFQTALAANGGQLSQRIYRMLDRPVPRRNALIWTMSLLVGLAAGSMAVAAQVGVRSAPAPEAPVPAAATEAVADTPAAPAPVSDTNASAGPEAVAAPEAAVVAESEPRQVPAATPGSEAREPSAARSAPAGETVAANTPRSADRRTERASRQPADAAGEPRREARPSPEPEKPAAEPVPEAAGEVADEPTSGQQAGAVAPPVPEPILLARAAQPPAKAGREVKPEVRGGKPLVMEAPDYPRHARLRGLQGNVTAEFTVNASGRVEDVNIVEASPAGVFDRAVTDALAQWRFEPMTRGGEPVERRVSKVFAFNLSSETARPGTASACDPVTGTRICRPWSQEIQDGTESL